MLVLELRWHALGKSDVSTPSGGFLRVKALLGAKDFAYVSLGSGQDGASGTQEEV